VIRALFPIEFRDEISIGHLPTGRILPMMDSLIAAIALQGAFTLVKISITVAGDRQQEDANQLIPTAILFSQSFHHL
jgi:hypothetical protein